MGNSSNTCVLNQTTRQCIFWARNSVCRHPNKWAKVGSQRQRNLLWATKQNALHVFGPFDATQATQRLHPGSQKKAVGHQTRPKLRHHSTQVNLDLGFYTRALSWQSIECRGAACVIHSMANLGMMNKVMPCNCYDVLFTLHEK
jgi:hypothetical protein